MILIVDSEKRRLCKDKRWRWHALFGTYSSCVRQYLTIGGASRTAAKIKGIVVKIPNGFSIDAAGAVIETVPVGNDNIRHIHHDILEFAI